MSVQNYQCRKCVAMFQARGLDCAGNESQIKCPECGSMEVDMISNDIMDAIRRMVGFGGG